MVSIRPMAQPDLQKLSEIFTEVYRVFDVGERWTPETARVLLAYWFKKQPDLAFVAELDGELVGAFVSSIKPWWDGNRLVDGEIFVHPEYQKQGVGRELLKNLFQEAVKKYDAKVWDAFTFSRFDFPLSWYKTIGFSVPEEWVIISTDVRNTLSILENK